MDKTVDRLAARLEYSWYLPPLARLLKLYSGVLNLVHAAGPIPEGLSSTAALRLVRGRSAGEAGTHAIDRRAFVRCCSLLTLSLAGCSRALSNTRLARLVVTDPHPDEYLPILRDVIRAVLPFGRAGFPPLAPEAVEHRLLELFPLERGAEFGAARRALTIFGETDLFPDLQPPVVAEERDQLRERALSRRAIEAAIVEQAEHDRRLYGAFLDGSRLDHSGRFTALTPEQRFAYLGLWSRSAFAGKRRFYQGVKRLVMVTAYTSPELWTAIGYAGPLLGGRR